TYPRVAENRKDVDVEARSLFGERRFGTRSAVALCLVGHEVASGHVHELDAFRAQPSRPTLSLAELVKQLLRRLKAFCGALDLLLEHWIPDAHPVDRRSVPCHDRHGLTVFLTRLRRDPPGKVPRVVL